MASSEEKKYENKAALLFVLREDQLSIHHKLSKIEETLKDFEERIAALENEKKQSFTDTPGGAE